ncbi:MAG: DUF4147 domain-containing protein [Thaumarchaeota archaeon]|nr:DUF4147 domain-containing protein [Nitrososphaerota archaeon]
MYKGQEMIIRNFKQLASDSDKKLALKIIERGLAAAMPKDSLDRIVRFSHLQIGRKRLSLGEYGRIHVVAIGKSADLMTKVVDSRTRLHGGIVVIPRSTHSMVSGKKFTVLQSSHPIPTAKSVIAARKIVGFLKSLDTTDLVIFLISGGASSLVTLPDGISLKDKRLVTDLLLKSGANIREVNCVRKHLSQVKGGRLVESLRCSAVSLVMSDVVGDDLSVIASGITYCDRSTFSDAKKVLLKYDRKNLVPKPVWKRIVLGTRGAIPETPKKPRIENYVISTNKTCIHTMEKYAKKLGFTTKTVWPLEGNVKSAASKLLRHFPSPNSCIVFGGETTVAVEGKGKGGRNQELVLNLMKKLKDRKEKVIVVSVGTDGIDGNTCAAGAIADSAVQPKSADAYLDQNNSHCYFKKYGGVIFTGPTHTNLMDIGLILRK